MGGFKILGRSPSHHSVALVFALLASASMSSCNLFMMTAFPGVTGQVAAPTMNPTTGTFSSDQSVAISCATSGSTIHYTTDGTAPTDSSPTYSSPISVAGNSTTMRIRAIAIKSGWKDSPTSSDTYTINYQQVSTPQLSPAGGTYSSDQSIAITCSTPGVTIYYTTNNTTPTTSSAIYGGSPIPVDGNGTTMTIQALATKTGMLDSTVAIQTYTISYPVAAVPTFSPTGGQIGHATTVTISSATPGASIAYTIDGTTPTEASGAVTHGSLYSGPIQLPYGTTAVNAIAFKAMYLDSAVGTASFQEPVFAYSVNKTPNTVAAQPINLTNGSLGSSSGGSIGNSPNSAAADPAGKYLYVTNQVDKTISAFSIAPSTGSLTAVAGQPFPTSTYQPYFVASTPVGPFMYATVNGGNAVLGFSIGGGGALSSPTVTLGTTGVGNAVGLVAHPSAPYLYVAVGDGIGHGSVDVYQINTVTGALTLAGNYSTAGTFAYAVAIDPAGRFLYVANGVSHSVSVFTVNSTNGSLTPVGSPITTFTNPIALTVDPTGRFLYVADNISSGLIFGFAINQSTGALTAMTPASFSTGALPNSLSVEPSGRYLYTVCSTTISYAAINSTTGALGAGGSAGQPGIPLYIVVTGPQ